MARKRKSAAETVETAELAKLPRRRIGEEERDSIVAALDGAIMEIEDGATYYKAGKRVAEIVGLLLRSAT